MSEQLDRIETMLIRQEGLLKSIGRIVYNVCQKADLQATAKDLDELRRALKEMRVKL